MSAYVRVQNKIKDKPFFCKSVNKKDVSEQCIYDIKSKLNPYMEPLWDNLKFIKNQFHEADKNFKRIDEMVQAEKLLVTPLAYIRGRSLSNVIFIVDEAQNVTHDQMEMIVTRIGKNSKMMVCGDTGQVDLKKKEEYEVVERN